MTKHLSKHLPMNDEDVTDSPNRHSFVVRVWLEEKRDGDHHEIYRGHITEISGGERHYFKNLNEIPSLIESHMKRVEY